MSLYQLVNPPSKDSPKLLDFLEPIDVPRYRDCFFQDQTTICVRTRTGGGNREEYENANEEMTQHPCYISDSDCDWDTTYADFLFSFPPKHKEKLEKMAAAAFSQTPKEKNELQKVFFGE